MSKYYKAEDVERVLSVYLERSYVLEGIEWLSKRAIEVSEDCISREWVKGICKIMLDEEMLGHMLGYIEDAPSVVPICQKNRQVERAEGEWIIDHDFNSICSNCGAKEIEFIYGSEMWYGKGESKFCPNCGAKMKGDE